jgi:transcription initiation factor IIE alpha subunit
MGNHVPSNRESQMDREEPLAQVAAKMTLYNMFLAEAIFDLLPEKGILTNEEITERIKKLKNEIPPTLRWMQ